MSHHENLYAPAPAPKTEQDHYHLLIHVDLPLATPVLGVSPMPFPTDQTCPPGLVTIFNIARAKPSSFENHEQMRSRYGLMLGDCPCPRLWGVSLLSTCARIYCGDTGTYDLEPPAIEHPNPLRLLPPTFLSGQWDLDLMSEEGFKKMKDIVAHIKAHAHV
ncbi:hypothetical protein CVT24_011899 [Panaeolus cyanescens]|uniref:Uncharacterized protein n=1 Tax=Panaeolus cyanescens TaxID=181874 RepID=A0A409YNU7_9AGAR|nr:hypothetical protein CVT24_011899 [Panaeolus cyanescens]